MKKKLSPHWKKDSDKHDYQAASNPATVLQLHPSAKIYLDEPAASSLERIDYYKWVFQNKPAWQADL